MQKWEYKTVLRTRGFKAKQKPKVFNRADDWDIDIVKELEKLGIEGWELIAISPRSRYLGGVEAWIPTGGSLSSA